MKRNYRARRAPINVRNNVRTEPCSVEIYTEDVKSGENTIKFAATSIIHRLSSLILPAEVTSVTFEGLTYYPAKQGS
jgi:hypothetical protein